MSTPVLIIGESGYGKSYSMRNLDPANTLLVQAVAKPLPWRGAKEQGWKLFDATSKTGNIFVTDKAQEVVALMQGTKRKTIVVDDYQYVLSNELLRKWNVTGYAKFSEVGYNGLNMITVASTLAPDVHIYFLAHSEMGEDGITRVKTPGKLMSSYVVEGLFSMVLKATIRDGKHYFATMNSGSDTVKAPVGMFDEELIDNDLDFVDKSITAFGW